MEKCHEHMMQGGLLDWNQCPKYFAVLPICTELLSAAAMSTC